MSNPTVQSILQQIAKLSEGEKAELRARLDQQLITNGLDFPDQSVLKIEPKDVASLRWLNKHRDEYIGHWIALDGDQLLAHGTDLSSVATEARAKGVQYPLLHFVEPEPEYPYIRS
ncbi:MAG: DUF5678 domain-containing protein [Acidobacteria bacterium]|nr:DUF5678 domain-containing protein [Acidobacteriota bacterium]